MRRPLVWLPFQLTQPLAPDGLAYLAPLTATFTLGGECKQPGNCEKQCGASKACRRRLTYPLNATGKRRNAARTASSFHPDGDREMPVPFRCLLDPTDPVDVGKPR